MDGDGVVVTGDLAMTTRRANGTFLPGGTPTGPRKRRVQFQAKFLDDLAVAWERDGKAALKIMAIEEPAKFVQACVALMPREVALEVGGPLTELSNEDLENMIQHYREARAKVIDAAPRVIEHESRPYEN
jgi:hypothetical protein